MRLLMTISARSGILLLAVAGMVLLFPHRDPEAAIDSGREKDSPESMKLFYAQRLYGSGDVNIFDRALAVYSAVAGTSQDALSKGNVSADNAWESLGPLNISGRVRGLAIHPGNPSTLFAASASGGVWKTTNSGSEWFPISDDLPSLANGAIAIDPNNPDRIFIGTGEPTGLAGNSHGTYSPAYLGVGVIRTLNGGASWEVMPWPNGKSAIHRIALHPADADTLFAASTSDLWKSTNGGQAWSRLLTGVITDVLYTPGRPSRVYAAIGRDYGSSANGVYVSDAGGRNFSFRKLTTNFPDPDSTGRIVMAISPANPDRVYAAVALNRSLMNGSNDFFMVLVSTNGGETWERRPNAISRSFTNTIAYYTLTIGVSPTDANTVFLGAVDWWRSTNGGTTFSKRTDWSLRNTNPNSGSYVHADQHAIVFKPGDPNTIFVGSDGGVHMSTNGGVAWSMRTYKMITTQYYAVNIDSRTPYMVYGGTQDQSNQRQNGAGDKNWSYLSGGDGSSIAVDPVNPQIIFISVNGNPRRTTDGGSSFSDLTNGLGAGPAADRQFWWRPMMLHPADRTLLFTSSQYVYRVKNPGTASTPTWQIISPDLSGSSVVVDLAVPKQEPDWMYAVTANGRAWISKDVRSGDPQWTNISTGLPNRWLSKVFVDQDDPNTAYVAASGYGTGHVFKTTNTGQQWIDISGDLPDLPAGSVVRSNTDVNTLFAATDFGVWFTTNGGTNWKRFGSGLPNLIAYDMIIAPDNRIIVGSHGRGMWATSSVLPTDRPENLPLALNIGQNYPNPVRDVTRVPFTLARATHVRLTVHDAAGRTVAVLRDAEIPAGEHTAEFSAASVPPGLYFVELRSGAAKVTKKLTVVR